MRRLGDFAADHAANVANELRLLEANGSLAPDDLQRFCNRNQQHPSLPQVGADTAERSRITAAEAGACPSAGPLLRVMHWQALPVAQVRQSGTRPVILRLLHEYFHGLVWDHPGTSSAAGIAWAELASDFMRTH